MILKAQQNDTLDSLIFRHYGYTAGLVETALNYNPETATQAYLWQGQQIIMPDDVSHIATFAETVNLWD